MVNLFDKGNLLRRLVLLQIEFRVRSQLRVKQEYPDYLQISRSVHSEPISESPYVSIICAPL
jgi:hypothetical protein